MYLEAGMYIRYSLTIICPTYCACHDYGSLYICTEHVCTNVGKYISMCVQVCILCNYTEVYKYDSLNYLVGSQASVTGGWSLGQPGIATSHYGGRFGGSYWFFADTCSG